MEILYLYFLPTPKIRFGGQNINFGGKYRFKYDEAFKELTVSENPFYIDDFFSLENNTVEVAKVLNVTSIIGENGAGKSSLLKLIKNSFVQGAGGIGNSMIFGLKNDDDIIVYHFEDIPIQKHNLAEYKIRITTLKPEINRVEDKEKKLKLEYSVPPSISDFSFTDFISFSNIFDGEPEMEFKGGYNLTTNFLIRNDYIRNLENGIIKQATNQRQIDIHLYEEIERQIAFINRYLHEKFIPFELPEYIYVSSKREISYDFGYSKEEKETLQGGNSSDDIVYLIGLFNKFIAIPDDEKRRLVNYFIASCILNFLLEMAVNYGGFGSIKFEQNNAILESNDDIQRIAIVIIDDIIKYIERSFGLHEIFIKWIEGVKSFISNLPALVSKEDIPAGDLNLLALKVTGESKEDFRKLYNSYRDSYLLKPYLNFKWRNLSTGENALFNIYSRFYSLSNEERKADELEKNVIVLVDEGDAYLHPAWQKRFVYLLLDFLPRAYAKTKDGTKRNIQIVLTTNSPIPASDLPNDNTIFLEKNVSISGDKESYVSRITVKDSLNDQRETFAANIYTLLSDSFFIKDGLIGEFASLKINTIIRELTKGSKPDIRRREQIRNIIYQIGEPILKSKLIQLYNQRFNLDIHERLDNIEKTLGI